MNFFASLIEKYSIIDVSSHVVLATAPVNDDQSVGINLPNTIENILAYSDSSTINKYALASEKYFREMKGVRLMGGLHDYINTLTNDQVINYILEKAQIYPELGNINYLASLDAITDETAHAHFAVASPMMGGGLIDIIRTFDRKTLLTYAFAMDQYRSVNGSLGQGNLLYSYTDVDLQKYILSIAKLYPVMNSKKAVEDFIIKYDIVVADL